MVSVAQRKSAGLWLRRSRYRNSSLTPNGRVAEWFKAPSWKGGEGNTSASSNLVSSSKVVCLVVGQLKLCRVSAHHLFIGVSSNG